MKVSELLEQLKKFSPDTEVGIVSQYFAGVHDDVRTDFDIAPTELTYRFVDYPKLIDTERRDKIVVLVNDQSMLESMDTEGGMTPLERVAGHIDGAAALLYQARYEGRAITGFDSELSERLQRQEEQIKKDAEVLLSGGDGGRV